MKGSEGGGWCDRSGQNQEADNGEGNIDRRSLSYNMENAVTLGMKVEVGSLSSSVNSICYSAKVEFLG